MGTLVQDAKNVAIASIHAMADGAPEQFAEMYTADAVTRERIAAPPEARGVGPDAFYLGMAKQAGWIPPSPLYVLKCVRLKKRAQDETPHL